MKSERKTPVEIGKEEFQGIGHRLVDDIADLLYSIREKPVTPGESPGQLQELLAKTGIPKEGSPAADLFVRATDLMFNHSLFNGHPKFLGYITSSPAPAGILAELLAAAVNPNVGAQILSPVATEIEKQTVRWLAELIGFPAGCGGLLVSGGNMANFTGFLAARTIKGPETINREGLTGTSGLLVYCSGNTHIWIEKAARLFGLGTDSVRWIDTDHSNRMNTEMLDTAILRDMDKGFRPLMVVGTAGDVSTGVVDNLKGIAGICKKYGLWFHVDGAYGGPAASVPDLKPLFEGIEEADSVALDPHKWLYSPLEAGCTLVKNPDHLADTFSTEPEYYNFNSPTEGSYLNYYEYGLQNSRGFRALKVWIMLQHAGREGYRNMIRQDIELSVLLFSEADKHPELEAMTQNLSVTTFRYVPQEDFENDEKKETYLNLLNETLLNNLQKGGELFLSNAMVQGRYCLRACVVNYRTSAKDIPEIIQIVVREGRKAHMLFQNSASGHSR